MNTAMPDETQKVLGVAKRPVITTSTGDPYIWNLTLQAKWSPIPLPSSCRKHPPKRKNMPPSAKNKKGTCFCKCLFIFFFWSRRSRYL